VLLTMRIAIIGNTFPSSPSDDPAFPASWELAKGLVAAGHQVLVLSLSSDDSDREGAYSVNGINVYKVRMRNPGLNVLSSHPKLR